MTEKKKILFEDLSVPGGQYNQTDSNPSGTSQIPRKVNLLDLLDYQKKADGLMNRAPKVVPYPLTQNVIEQIGEIYVQAAKIQSELGQSYQSPLISDDEDAAKTIKSLYTKLQKVKLIVKSVADELKQLDIEK
tara:strand:- start:827 stop:1225 length:399 start_codon:yes stop_codon:yes gene_type:complete